MDVPAGNGNLRETTCAFHLTLWLKYSIVYTDPERIQFFTRLIATKSEGGCSMWIYNNLTTCCQHTEDQTKQEYANLPYMNDVGILQQLPNSAKLLPTEWKHVTPLEVIEI